jgi:transcriptional regulator with XRE-family HTH domain
MLTTGQRCYNICGKGVPVPEFPVPAEFKRLIEAAQSRLGLSLRQLAKESGLSVSFLSRILGGDRKIPKNEDIIRLAKALQLSPRDLLIAAGRVPPNEPQVGYLLRAVGKLTPEELREVRDLAEKLIKGHKARGHKTK